MAEEKKEKNRMLGDRLEGADIKSEKKVQVGDRLEGANINSEKKRQLDDPLPGDRSEGANVVKKKKEKMGVWKMLRLAGVVGVMLFTLSIYFTGGDLEKILGPATELKDVPFYIKLLISGFFLIFYSLATAWLFIDFKFFQLLMPALFGLFDILSSSEKAKREMASGLSVEEKELRRQIKAETNYAARKKLRQQAFELRQEYESLLIENLQTKKGEVVKDWREVLLSARRRLLNEEERLLARNGANLRIGIGSVLLGVVLLIIFLFLNGEAKDNSNFIDFLTIYWARIGIVITIGVFAGFFLRLYSLTERAIAKNKNEMTNIELRLTSGLMLCDTKDKANLTSLADDLAKEERNFILGKNESSATSETLDNEKLLGIISKLAMKAGGVS